MQKLLLLSAAMLLMTCSLSAQNNRPLNRLPTAGLLIDYPIVEEVLPESVNNGYNPILIQANFRFPLIKNNGLHQATLYVQPQFNPVLPITGYNQFLFETGVNLGIAYEYYIPQKAILFIGGSIGPHYINIETDLQANGFIFSDNLFAGVHQIVDRNWMLTYQVKFRHISNAGLQSPNGGIDNFFAGVGVSYFLR
jgi:hypothetical protein